MAELDVFNALVSLDPTKSMGIDGIGSRLLKHCAVPLYQVVVHLFSLSLSQHYLPKDWRIHQIKPIFKSGDKTLVKNYRPIALLSSVSKVLERIVYNNIIGFVNNFVSDCQFGFLQNQSTLQQLIVFFHHLQEHLNNMSQVDVVYLDFKKAFDSIVHNVLLYKHWRFGITDNIWHWIRAYLTDSVFPLMAVCLAFFLSFQVCLKGAY